MNLEKLLARRILVLDGAMGTALLARGAKGALEMLNVEQPSAVEALHEAYIEAGADIIMLDNMSVEDMKEAVKLAAGKAETECSGNVTKENVAKLVDIGVDYISSGALTHSSPILDLSLKNLHAI